MAVKMAVLKHDYEVTLIYSLPQNNLYELRFADRVCHERLTPAFVHKRFFAAILHKTPHTM